jgi:hypothetical protein
LQQFLDYDRTALERAAIEFAAITGRDPVWEYHPEEHRVKSLMKHPQKAANGAKTAAG